MITGNPAIEAINDSLAPPFVAGQPYSMGDYVNHNGSMYVFTDDYAGGSFADAPVSLTTITAQIELLPNKIIEYVGQQGYGKTYIQPTDPTLDPDNVVTKGDYWIRRSAENTWGGVDEHIWDEIKDDKWGVWYGEPQLYCWDGEQWVRVFDASQQSTMFTKITQVAEMITQEAYRANAAEGELSSMIKQTAGFITQEVSRATDSEIILSSRITQTADSITSEVTRATAAEGVLSSKIEQTDHSITMEVNRANNVEGELSSRITVTANAITSEVSRATAAEGNLSSRISQTAEAITTEVTRAKAAESGLIAKAGNISTVADLQADAQQKANEARDAAKDASILKTATYQSAAGIYSAAVAAGATNLAPAFSTSKAYVIGDIVSYNGAMYQFKTAHSAGAWNASHVNAVTTSGSFIAKTTQYQTAQSIVSAAEQYVDGQLTSYSTISQTSTAISQYVTNNAYGKVSGITITASGVDISGSQYVKIASGGYFSVTTGNFGINTNASDYVMWSGSASASASSPFYLKKDGTIHATSGTIGGWTLGSNYLGDAGTLAGCTIGVRKGTSDNHIVFFSGGDGSDIANAKFRVQYNGHLKATDAEITGKITATSGSVGGWTIGSNYLGNNTTRTTSTIGMRSDAVHSGSTDNIAIWAGGTPSTSSGSETPFYVTASGKLHATSGDFSGNVQANKINGRVPEANINQTIVNYAYEGHSAKASIDTLFSSSGYVDNIYATSAHLGKSQSGSVYIYGQKTTWKSFTYNGNPIYYLGYT